MLERTTKFLPALSLRYSSGICRTFRFLGEGRDRPRRYPDVGFDAHVAHAHGGPSRHVPGAVREHGTYVNGSVRSFRAFRFETGKRKTSLPHFGQIGHIDQIDRIDRMDPGLPS